MRTARVMYRRVCAEIIITCRVFYKGKGNLKKVSILSYGVNQMGDVNGNTPGIHAECDAIYQIKDKYPQADIEIISVRINRNGEFRLAKPCPHCQKVLDILGYYNVWWSITCDDGSNKLTLSNDKESINYKYAKL